MTTDDDFSAGTDATDPGTTTLRWFSVENLKELPIPQKASLLVGFIYLAGYLITQIFVRSLGIAPLPFGKAQYIESGLMFTVVTSTLIFLPLGIYDLVNRMGVVTKSSRLEVLRRMIIPLNYCLVLLFFALLITKYEMTASASFFYVPMQVQTAFCWYLSVILLGMWIVSGLRSESRFAKAIGWGLLFFSLYFDLFMALKVCWAWSAISAMRYYLLLVAMLVYMGLQTRKALRQAKDKNVQMEMLLINAIFYVVTIYLTITAYSYTVYKTVPTSRGGALPVVSTTLQLSTDVASIYPEIISSNDPSRILTRPLFLVDGGSDCVYAVTNFNPFDSFEGNHVYVFKAGQVISVSYEPYNVRSNEWSHVNPDGAVPPHGLSSSLQTWIGL
jgi:hypothetical protein